MVPFFGAARPKPALLLVRLCAPSPRQRGGPPPRWTPPARALPLDPEGRAFRRCRLVAMPARAHARERVAVCCRPQSGIRACAAYSRSVIAAWWSVVRRRWSSSVVGGASSGHGESLRGSTIIPRSSCAPEVAVVRMALSTQYSVLNTARSASGDPPGGSVAERWLHWRNDKPMQTAPTAGRRATRNGNSVSRDRGDSVVESRPAARLLIPGVGLEIRLVLPAPPGLVIS
jgi:hypothetical protein